MTDYMKEAERLLDELRTCTLAEATHYASPDFKRAKASEEAANRARSALLAHIQRGAVLEGWQLVPKEPTEAMLLAGLGSNWPEDLYLRDVYESMLAAAPAPDHFRDDPDPLHLSRILHELAGAASLCWEPRPTGVFDSQLAIQFVEQALAEIRSRMTPAPAEVPMPKPVAYGFGNTAITGHTNRLMMVRIDIPGGDQYAGAFWLPLVLADEAHTYGIACRAAGEAAGYARGLRDAVRDAERRGQFLVECNDVALRIDPFGYGIYDAIDGDGQPYQSQALADEIAALRGEEK